MITSVPSSCFHADYLEVMQRLAAELDGKPFYYTEKMFDITKARFHDIEIFEYFLSISSG